MVPGWCKILDTILKTGVTEKIGEIFEESPPEVMYNPLTSNLLT